MDTSTELERIWREEWGRLLALLVGRFRRLDLAEDALADAFEAAARSWRADGIPTNPAAWLLTSARRRALDRLRAEAVAARKVPMLVVDARTQEEAHRAMADPGDAPAELADERLRLALLCAHPSLAPEAAAALTLRMVLGVSTADLARLFLVTESTMAARLTRARKKLAVAGVPFVMPAHERLAGRIEVLGAVAYLAFTAGYAPGSGPDVVRIELAGEAIRLTRLLRSLVASSTGGAPVTATGLDPLLALMLLQHSRRDARVDADGDLVLLPAQDRGRWRSDEIAEGLGLLRMIEPSRLDPQGYQLWLQAAIAAEHARATTPSATDWPRIAELYAALDRHTEGSPVVRLARAVAVAEANGPLAGLELLAGLDQALPSSHRVPGVRAELLARAGLATEAASAYEQAIALCRNDAERRHLIAQRAKLGG